MSSGNLVYNTVDYYIYSVDEIDSTNTYLKENYLVLCDKTVIITNKQTAGRGRFNRNWVCDNDIAFSILFKEFHRNEIIAPLAIINALKEMNIDAKIKWPNDIYFQNKKLAGILIEDVYLEKFKASIVGIGINMSNKEEFNGIGLNEYINLSKREIIEKILIQYDNLLKLPKYEIMEQYQRYNLIIGLDIKYKDEIYKAEEILDNGYLVLSNSKQKITISSNEIDIKSSIYN